ncbi:prohibitin family protein [Paraburkholderia tagetis]|uniref:Prohibitin family protein n=1 Tax=Paraburkholderia tagetis TaxID=2913261 RepID=A0A9X2A0X3_9BURK|nr:prohibitin family protein [Paraburkholderia tagetis]MCG5078664.1 prohibitin family protein [Paraburkholderia tagetis]
MSVQVNMPTKPRAVGLTVIVFLVFALIVGGFVTVGPGQRGVLMTWGAVEPGVLDPGLHLKVPFAQSVAKMDVQVQNSQDAETAASLDLQDVTTTVATNWHILPADAEWVYQHIGNESALVVKIIKPAISNSVKAVTAHYNAEDLITHRDQVRGQIEAQITAELKPYRLMVDSVNITDFHFSTQFAQAIEQKQVAQQRAQQAQYELQKARVLADQKIVEAHAQAEAQKLLQQTITPEIIQQQAVAKWDGHLPEVLGSSGVLPMLGNLGVGKVDR